MFDERGRPFGFPPIPPVVVEDLKPEDDQRATSNLFIGNLDHNVTEVDRFLFTCFLKHFSFVIFTLHESLLSESNVY